MKNLIAFTDVELRDLYYALATASNYHEDMLKKAKDKCGCNLTAENYAEYRKREIKFEETKKLREKVFVLLYNKTIKKGGKL